MCARMGEVSQNGIKLSQLSQRPMSGLSVPSRFADVSSISIVLPWACLVGDNHRLMAIGSRMVMSAKYRNAKDQMHTRARIAHRGPAWTGDVEIRCVLYFPDARKRDAGNYRKAITDALSGVVYRDDQQIRSETWSRGEIDRENPRAELTIVRCA